MDFISVLHGLHERCSCGRFVPMPTVEESVCCREQPKVCARREEEGTDIHCATEHAGFQTVCLNEHVLRTAHFHYQQDYADVEGMKWKRYTAYRQFVRWCYEYLGRRVRVPLPSCVVSSIRRTFPSTDYRGFQDTNSP
ncbi:P2X purinoceptor 7-like [Engraulis encrasicolus]|uniref:P2X purinoceptor 7-like n=1 Tax=Engraulis encrasicolus TaxID=184585 RepID=UPI002FD18110